MPNESAVLVRVGRRAVQLTNLDKVYWPEDGLAKGDLIDYYAAMAPFILPHLKDRPLSLVRYPSGTAEKGFYQKDAPAKTPTWVRLAPLWSKDRGSYINFILCDNIETLVWMANTGVVEVNPWLSRFDSPGFPDVAVIDIDPSDGTTWDDVKVVARLVKELLDRWGLRSYPKVSGATGLHVYIPVQRKYTYQQVQSFVKRCATLVRDAYPEKVTMERKVKDRTGRVYIDYPQNARGQTISSVYGVRATPGAPVSMPIAWRELDEVTPKSWSILTAPQRARSVGDLFREVLTRPQSLDPHLSGTVPGKHN